MSTTPPLDLAGLNIKEWSMIILMVSLGIVFAVFGIAMAIAITNDPQITITGEIDIGQFANIIIVIAVVATVLVSQQLTQKAIAQTIRQSDDAWAKNP